MRDKITLELHEIAVELRANAFSLVQIGQILGIHHSALSADLRGQRKTPYRPSPETAIPILEAAIARLRAKAI